MGIRVEKRQGLLPCAVFLAANLIVIVPFHENSYPPNIGSCMPEGDLISQEIPDEPPRQIRQHPVIPSRRRVG